MVQPSQWIGVASLMREVTLISIFLRKVDLNGQTDQTGKKSSQEQAGVP